MLERPRCFNQRGRRILGQESRQTYFNTEFLEDFLSKSWLEMVVVSVQEDGPLILARCGILLSVTETAAVLVMGTN